MADKFNKPEQLAAFNSQYPTKWNQECTFGIYTNPQGVQFVIVRTLSGTRFEQIQG